MTLSEFKNGRNWAVLVALLGIAGALMLLLHPFWADRLGMEGRVSKLEQSDKQHASYVTREELKPTLDEITRRLQRIEDKLDKEARRR